MFRCASRKDDFRIRFRCCPSYEAVFIVDLVYHLSLYLKSLVDQLVEEYVFRVSVTFISNYCFMILIRF